MSHTYEVLSNYVSFCENLRIRIPAMRRLTRPSLVNIYVVMVLKFQFHWTGFLV